jgi:hypothetical protein
MESAENLQNLTIRTRCPVFLQTLNFAVTNLNLELYPVRIKEIPLDMLYLGLEHFQQDGYQEFMLINGYPINVALKQAYKYRDSNKTHFLPTENHEDSRFFIVDGMGADGTN